MARLVTIGSKGGPALRRAGAMPTSSLVDFGGAAAVVDCGLGVTRGLVEAGIDLCDLPPVFITHLHSDHVLELGPLLHTAWVTGLRRQVDIYGPPGIADHWRGFCTAMAFDHALRESGGARTPIEDLVRLHEIGEGVVHESDSMQVAALRVHHPPVPDCFALRFDAGGKRVTFSADTTFHEPLAGFAWGSDLLVHEAMLPEAVERNVADTGLGERLRADLHACHSTAAEAARLAGLAAIRRLVLHHLIPADDPGLADADWLDAVAKVWDGSTVIARDKLEIAF